jgi:ubiquinone/menaquinone biosynthesis C-methylase UbiE
MYQSETSKFRFLFLDYCKGNGIDVGFGGDPIVPTAITIDLSKPYAETGKSPQNLKGDGRNLYWFNDNTLDYVYSSHLLEDFIDTKEVLQEWIRVLKPNGYLLLLLPDEQRCRVYFRKSCKPYNEHHKHEDFSLNKIKEILKSLEVKIIKEIDNLVYEPEQSDYNFAIIAQKNKGIF